jgi:hypothetical protein
VLLNPEDESELNAVAKEVHALMDQRPLFVGYTD